MSEREKTAWNEIDEAAAREGSARRREFRNHFSAAVVAKERKGTGVDDRATTLGDHLRGRGPARLERGAEVCVEQVAELCGRHGQDRRSRWLWGTGAVHQDVDAPEFGHARVDQRIRGRGIGGGAGEPDAAGPDACDGLADGRLVAAVDDDARAEPGQQFGYLEPDAARATDDDRTAAVQFAGQASSWPNCIASMFQ